MKRRVLPTTEVCEKGVIMAARNVSRCFSQNVGAHAFTDAMTALKLWIDLLDRKRKEDRNGKTEGFEEPKKPNR